LKKTRRGKVSSIHGQRNVRTSGQLWEGKKETKAGDGGVKKGSDRRPGGKVCEKYSQKVPVWEVELGKKTEKAGIPAKRARQRESEKVQGGKVENEAGPQNHHSVRWSRKKNSSRIKRSEKGKS